jgi:hypothetical protein
MQYTNQYLGRFYMKKLLGFVLIHPVKQDFVFGLHMDDGLEVVAYAPTPQLAKLFKDFKEIESFVLHLEQCNFDVAKLFDVGDHYVVEFETTVSTSSN